MQQGPPQATPPEQVTYLSNLLKKGHDAGFVTDLELHETLAELEAVQGAYDTIMELMKKLEPAYTTIQVKVMETLHEGALIKNGHKDGAEAPSEASASSDG